MSAHATLPGGHNRPDFEQTRDDWEDWEDDEVVTPIMDDEQDPIVGAGAFPLPPRTSKRMSTRASKPRHSVQRLKRLHSRQRQKTQNEKAGIKLVTDMSQFRRQNGTIRNMIPQDRPAGKFVDAAALKALEGDPNSASVGNWNWLKKNSPMESFNAAGTPTKSPMVLSPEDRPIVIGISLPSDAQPQGNASTDADAHMVPTPLDATAHPNYPQTNPFANNSHLTPVTPSQQRSVWSPDTPDTASSFHSTRRSSSIYSQMTTMATGVTHDAPPVPAVPQNYQKQERLISLDFGENGGRSSLHPSDANTSHSARSHTATTSKHRPDNIKVTQVSAPEREWYEDDCASPRTLFEEDGVASAIPKEKETRAMGDSKSPDSADTQTRGWWDHVVTPFTEKTSPLREALQKSQQQLFVTRDPVTESRSVEEPTRQADNRARQDAPSTKFVPGLPSSPRPSPKGASTPIVKVPTPRRTPSPFMDHRAPSPASSSRSGTPRLAVPGKEAPIMTDALEASEQPPPYSPPNKQTAVRYRAVFPEGHPLHQLYPPSPRPVSPAMAGTMSSQGGINMTDIPLTPAPGDVPLPQRQPGTYVPREHFLAASGPENRVERERRRHEKEEVVARKMGGFWRGRGCLPANGCFGRSGREGRKRRRVWFGVCCGIIVAIILIIVLCVTLIPRGSPPEEIHSIFVNLTDFPPMPTGVLSVVGPDKRASATGCTQPSTAWSCSLPREDHGSAAPFRHDQPNFFMHIQWDNNTRQPWNVPNGEPPRPGRSGLDRRHSYSGGGVTALARAALERRQENKGFTPDPEPPSFQEMWFLGNTTDGIESDDNAGESTPFYISILESSKDAAGPNILNKRQDEPRQNASDVFENLPDPVLEDDGSAGRARFYPQAVQQPIRLFDRGLDTEHYGFYTYFDRSLYLRSVSVLSPDDDGKDVPIDKDGGSTRREANFVVTWSQTRFLVKMWTRRENSTRLLSEREATARPGTMPYPVTVVMDTHGGQPLEKFVWHWKVDTRQRIDTSDPKLIMNDISFGSEVVNPRSRNDTSFGGFDGGTGGCRCEWVNFIERIGGGRERVDDEEDE